MNPSSVDRVRAGKLGVVYVATHSTLRAVKVGYTNTMRDRRDQIAKRGWEPYRHLLFPAPSAARDVEQAALFQLRHLLLVPPYLIAEQMPDGGWTETASVTLISPQQLWDLVCEQAGLAQLAPSVTPIRAKSWYRPAPPPRRTGDTPKYVRAARVEAARTARAFQVGTSKQPKTAKNAAKKDPS